VTFPLYGRGLVMVDMTIYEEIIKKRQELDLPLPLSQNSIDKIKSVVLNVIYYAYDQKTITSEEFKKLQDLDVVVVGGLAVISAPAIHSIRLREILGRDYD
jgi:AICAR transformylase/IMP cyclohydrolase PurH